MRNLVSIDFTSSNASIAKEGWNLRYDGKDYACVTKGAPTVIPAIVPGGYQSPDSLQITLPPTSGPGPDDGRDKLNYCIVSGDSPYAPTFDDRTTQFAFAIKLDQSFQAPVSGSNYVLTQWWQGAPFDPPLALQLLNSAHLEDDPRIVFAIHNDQTGGNPSAKAVHAYPKSVRELVRERWYYFICRVKVSYDARLEGRLEVWINRDPVPGDQDVLSTGNIGYNPRLTAGQLGFTSGNLTAHPNRRMQIEVGPYRDRMPTTQTFYYDHISYAILSRRRPRVKDMFISWVHSAGTAGPD
jgi:Polysaccharide lyase